MGGNIDPTLRALKSVGRYQLLQVLVISLGYFGAAYQLLGNIFIGKSLSSLAPSLPPPPLTLPTSGLLTADVPKGFLQKTSHQWGTYSRRPTNGVLTEVFPPVGHLQQAQQLRSPLQGTNRAVKNDLF